MVIRTCAGTERKPLMQFIRTFVPVWILWSTVCINILYPKSQSNVKTSLTCNDHINKDDTWKNCQSPPPTIQTASHTEKPSFFIHQTPIYIEGQVYGSYRDVHFGGKLFFASCTVFLSHPNENLGLICSLGILLRENQPSISLIFC